MKYLSIDVETTGLDHERNYLLSVGAVIEDSNNPLPFSEVPKFHVAIKRRGDITGNLFALNMNSDLIKNIVEYQNCKDEEEKGSIEDKTGMEFLHEEEVSEKFFRFLWDNGIPHDDFPQDWTLNKNTVRTEEGRSYPVIGSNIPKTYLNVAGKNFGTFDLNFLEKLPRWKQLFKIRRRIIDPALLYVDWKEDNSLPGLEECKKRAGIDGKVTHNALEDAWDVVCTLRPFYTK